MNNANSLEGLSMQKRAGDGNSDKAPEGGSAPLPFDPGERAQSIQQEFYRLHREISYEITRRMENIQDRLDDLEPNSLDANDNEPTDWILDLLSAQARDLRETRAHITTITTYWRKKALEVSRDIQLLQETQGNNDILMPNGHIITVSHLQNSLSSMIAYIDDILGHLATIDGMLPNVYERAENLLNTRLDQLNQTYLGIREEIETPFNTLHSVITCANGIIDNPKHTQYGSTIEKIHELITQLSGNFHADYAREIGELYSVIHSFDGQAPSGIYHRMSEHNSHIAELRGISHTIALTEEVLSHIALQNQVMEDRDALNRLMIDDDNPLESIHQIISLSDKVKAVIRQYHESLVELDGTIDSFQAFENPPQLIQNSLAILKQINTLMGVRGSFISELESSSSREPEIEVYHEEMPSVEPTLFQEEGAVGGVAGVHNRTEGAIGSVAVGTTFGAIAGGSVGGPLGALGGGLVGGMIGMAVNESGIMERIDSPEDRVPTPEPYIYHDNFHYHTDL